MADGQPENGMNGKTRMCGCLFYGFSFTKRALLIFRLPLDGTAELFSGCLCKLNMAVRQPEKGVDRKTKMRGCLVYGFSSVKRALLIFRLPLDGTAELFFRLPLLSKHGW